MEEIIQDIILIAILIFIVHALLLWIFLYTAIKHGVKKAIEEILPNISIIDEDKN